MRIAVTRVFFYDAIPSLGTNCLKVGEWDPDQGMIYHVSGDNKVRACSATMVREMTIEGPVPPAPIAAPPIAEIAAFVAAQNEAAAAPACTIPVGKRKPR